VNSIQQKTLPFEGQGGYSIRATAAPEKPRVALRFTPKPLFEVSRYEIRF
jgi:hypothetical protein